jgi:hypothetical protein
MLAVKRWTYPSSSSSKTYDAILNDDGHLSCDCRGWTMKKVGKPRSCRHTDDVVLTQRYQTRIVGDYIYVVNGSASAPTRPATVTPAWTPTPAAVAPRASDPLADLYRSPMLADLMPDGATADHYATADYVAEEKFDGHRVVFGVRGGVVSAWSRPRAGSARGNKRELPPHIVRVLAKFPDMIGDGELTAPGLHAADVAALAQSDRLQLVAFDVIAFGPQALDRATWTDRREVLELAYATAKLTKVETAAVRISETFTPSQALVEGIWARGGEGIIIKLRRSRYALGVRSDAWLKVKQALKAPFTVTGFKAGKNSPCGVVMVRDDSGVATTVKAKDNADVARFEANPSAFIGRRCVVEFQERMTSGVPRHPRFDRFTDE